MTARDRAAAVAAKVIGEHNFYVTACACGWLTNGGPTERHYAFRAHLAAALADALVDEGLIADGETRVEVEHGHLFNGEMCGPIDNWGGYVRGELRATHQRTVTRTVTVGAWEVAGDA